MSADVAGFGDSVSESDSTQELLWGLGVAAHINPQWTVRAQFTRLNNVGDENFIGESDVDFLSAEVTYAF
jgi:hypothetical protein